MNWENLFEATNAVDKPVPGWLFKEICTDVEHYPEHVPDVAEHCMRSVLSHQRMVSLKGCLVVRHLAEEVFDFRAYMIRCDEALEHLARLARPPLLPQAQSLEREEDKIYRIAADRALRAVVSSTESFLEKECVRARCEGFGNYMPPTEAEEVPTGVAGLVNEMVGFVGDAVADTVDDFREKGAVGAVRDGIADAADLIFDSVNSVWGLLGGRSLGMLPVFVAGASKMVWTQAAVVLNLESPSSAGLAAPCMEFQRAKIEGECFADFWTFATSIPRCASVASRESQRLRGTWITRRLAVQKVHGYSLSSVRLLCVVAGSDDERQRLGDFFARDQRNLRARFRRMADPLDEEQRVLLKIPYDSSLDGWVEKEYQTLLELEGVPGIPRLYGQPFFFENLGVRALAMHFHSAPSLQERSGTPVDVYRMACFYLNVLDQVHQRGWIHGDLQPKDLLFHDPEGATVTFRQTEDEEASVSGMICGWSRASRRSAGESSAQWEERLLEFRTLERRAIAPSRDLTTLRPPSVFSAPEQYIALYTGEDLETEATDLYRLGACVCSALALPRSAGTAEAVEQLRRLCHQSLLGQQAQDWELELFCSAFDVAHRGVFQVNLSEGAEGLAQWLRRLLRRAPASAEADSGAEAEGADGAEAFGSAAEALEALRQAQPATVMREDVTAPGAAPGPSVGQAPASSSSCAIPIPAEKDGGAGDRCRKIVGYTTDQLGIWNSSIHCLFCSVLWTTSITWLHMLTAYGMSPSQELADLQGRLWTVCHRGQHVAVYVCVRSPNLRKRQIRLDLRCERLDGSLEIADVALQFSQVQVESSNGRVVLCSGPLQQRSAKVKANLDSSPFVAPGVFDLRCELEYTVKNDGGEAEAQKVPVELRLPATTFLVPQALGEEPLLAKLARAVSFEKSVSDLPMLVGRCAGLSHFHGIQQASGQDRRLEADGTAMIDMKFILVAATLPAAATALEGQSAAPSNALVICRCAALVRGSSLEMRVTVKAYQKEPRS
eukprot:s148_g6.t1